MGALDGCQTVDGMREANDFGVVLREAVWLGGCVTGAFAFTQLTEDKGNQTLFLSALFYLFSSGIWVAVRTWRRRGGQVSPTKPLDH